MDMCFSAGQREGASITARACQPRLQPLELVVDQRAVKMRLTARPGLGHLIDPSWWPTPQESGAGKCLRMRLQEADSGPQRAHGGHQTGWGLACIMEFGAHMGITHFTDEDMEARDLFCLGLLLPCVLNDQGEGVSKETWWKHPD